jgi:hypothetical protein
MALIWGQRHWQFRFNGGSKLSIQLIIDTLKALSARSKDDFVRGSSLSRALVGCRDALKEIDKAELSIEAIAVEFGDDIFDEIFSATDCETVISLSFNSDSISVWNHIEEFSGLFFFRGTDLDDRGPFETLESALDGAEVFYSERDEPLAELYFRNDVPTNVWLRVLNSIALCSGIKLSNDSGSIFIGDAMDIEEIDVFYDSDEFRACEIMASENLAIDLAISRLIDFHGMCEEDARAYYLEAQKNQK